MFNTVYWEVLRRNRPVLGMQLLLLALGAAVAVAATWSGSSDAAWLPRAEGLAVFAFFASLLLAFAVFSLTENTAGWRMNSMLTRWFVLPVPTAHLVFVPLVAAAGFLSLLMALWTPIFNRIAPGLDSVYFAAVLIAGMAAVHALAWTVPRKPGQFWLGAALLFPVVLLLSLVPQDQPGSELFRRRALLPLGGLSLGLGLFGWYAARRNRCGDWPGELPLSGLWQWLRQGGVTTTRRRGFRSVGGALFWSDSLPPLRLLALSWLLLGLVLLALMSGDARRLDAELVFSLRLLAFIALHLLPVLAFPWLAMWGLFLGCEPAAGFRTRLSTFRATLPVSSGVLAGQKLITLAMGWAIVWLPLLALSFWYDPLLSGTDDPDAKVRLLVVLSRWMAASASVLAGVLPLFLWGRFEGFPNLLLLGMCSWAAVWLLGENLISGAEEAAAWRTPVTWMLLAIKLAAATAGCVLALRRGHVSWRFPLWLGLSWSFIAAFLIWILPTWRASGLNHVPAILVYLPLARAAWCPIALAGNRHRR